ncbi:unnamed protein product [Callosobruchus maculatus]|uniref:RNA helicase n=1 Tax=Callosobruchus maculatus TaxID=64391 RepID=A0A653BL24_CALMS|nr:unnamed protein product [Callosobruchus maculatus]
MWSYITSFFWPSQDDDNLSLNEACAILETTLENRPEVQNVNTETAEHAPKNAFCRQTGTISQETESKYIIDDKFPFEKGSISFPVGTKVSYSYFINEGKPTVIDVDFVNAEWDEPTPQNGLWTTRILVCKVQQRQHRKLLLDPDTVEVDLDNVCIEFVPVVGDWLQLEVKCTVDEQAIDLQGKILEINKIIPLRSHMVVGKITSWNTDQACGTIDRNIYFDKNVLVNGYVPVVGDKVITQAIESEQNRCIWRALKVVPEYITKQNNRSANGIQLCNFKDSHPGLRIDYTKLSFERINTSLEFEVVVHCDTEEHFELMKAEFPNENSQCKINDSPHNTLVSQDKPCKIECSCTARTIGASKELLLLTFSDFSIGKWLDINVAIQSVNPKSQFQQHRNKKPTDTFGAGNLIKGQPLLNGSRFRTIRLPDYAVPKKLLSIVAKYDLKDYELLIEELKGVKPSLYSNLSHTNYEEKFHTLLHFDEIEGLLAIQRYDQERACFIQNGEYLMLEIENLSERRPSIVIGDKIIATDPLQRSTIAFEGFVHKVTARHLHLKFSPLFHDKYNGEDYTVRVVPGRAAYKRLHHAVYLAVRNLGPEILFPMRLYEKDPQLKFEYNLSKNPANRLKNLQAKIEEIKSRKSNKFNDQDSTVLKLEWYNTSLNETQKNAVVNILWGKARPLPYIIFGPPGTGKTVTLIETILQILRLLPQSRLLVAAPSNSAADLLALRLIDSGVLQPGDLVRLVSVNYALSDLIPPKLVPFCIVGTSSKEGTEQFNVQNGIQIGCQHSLMGRHRITVSTCSSSGQLFGVGFPKGHFTHIVVDEAAQASEPDVLIPLSFLDKSEGQAILAGDPMQLGPVILSKISNQFGLAESYLERLINRFPYTKDVQSFPDTCGYDPRLATKLLYNYRAVPSILNMYSTMFYDDELIPTINEDSSNEAMLLESLRSILPKMTSGKIPSVVFHGVDGENYQSVDSPSWYNPYEAAQIFYYVNELYRMGVKSSSIGVITPYIKQIQEIRSLMIEAEFLVPKVGTVEEFQGQEYDVVLLSTVRSCPEYVTFDVFHKLGFMVNPKRLNVAISRAKSLLVIVGNPKLLGQDIYWRSVIEYCLQKGCYVGCDFSS